MSIKTIQYNDFGQISLKGDAKFAFLLSEIQEFKKNGGNLLMEVKVNSKTYSHPFFYFSESFSENSQYNSDSFEQVKQLMELTLHPLKPQDYFEMVFENNNIHFKNGFPQKIMEFLIKAYPEEFTQSMVNITKLTLPFINKINEEEKSISADLNDIDNDNLDGDTSKSKSPLKRFGPRHKNRISFGFHNSTYDALYGYDNISYTITNFSVDTFLPIVILSKFNLVSVNGKKNFDVIATNFFERLFSIEGVPEFLNKLSEQAKENLNHQIRHSFNSSNDIESQDYIRRKFQFNIDRKDAQYISFNTFKDSFSQDDARSKAVNSNYEWSNANSDFISNLSILGICLKFNDLDIIKKNIDYFKLEHFADYYKHTSSNNNPFIYTSNIEQIKFFESIGFNMVQKIKDSTYPLFSLAKSNLVFDYLELYPDRHNSINLNISLNQSFINSLNKFRKKSLYNISLEDSPDSSNFDWIDISIMDDTEIVSHTQSSFEPFFQFFNNCYLKYNKINNNNMFEKPDSFLVKMFSEMNSSLHNSPKNVMKHILLTFEQNIGYDATAMLIRSLAGYSLSHNNKLLTGIKDYLKNKGTNIANPLYFDSFFINANTSTLQSKLPIDEVDANALISDVVSWWLIPSNHFVQYQKLLPRSSKPDVNAVNKDGESLINKCLTYVNSSNETEKSNSFTLLNKVFEVTKTGGALINISTFATDGKIPNIVHLINQMVENTLSKEGSNFADVIENSNMYASGKFFQTTFGENASALGHFFGSKVNLERTGLFVNKKIHLLAPSITSLFTTTNLADIIPQIFDALDSQEQKRFYKNLQIALAEIITSSEIQNDPARHAHLMNIYSSTFSCYENYEEKITINKYTTLTNSIDNVLNNISFLENLDSKNSYFILQKLYSEAAITYSDFQIYTDILNSPEASDLKIVLHKGVDFYKKPAILVHVSLEIDHFRFIDAVSLKNIPEPEDASKSPHSIYNTKFKPNKARLGAISNELNKYLLARELNEKLEHQDRFLGKNNLLSSRKKI